jgi:hypothetical protein
MKKLNKYGCSPSEDVCLEHDSPLITFGMCEDSPDIKAFISQTRQADVDNIIQWIDDNYQGVVADMIIKHLKTLKENI